MRQTVINQPVKLAVQLPGRETGMVIKAVEVDQSTWADTGTVYTLTDRTGGLYADGKKQFLLTRLDPDDSSRTL